MPKKPSSKSRKAKKPAKSKLKPTAAEIHKAARIMGTVGGTASARKRIAKRRGNKRNRVSQRTASQGTFGF